VATNDELKNQKELNKGAEKFRDLKKETIAAQKKANEYSDQEAKSNSSNVDFARMLNAELKEQLGVRQRISDQAKDLRNLGNEVVRNAQQNVVELGNTNKLEREIINQQMTRSKLISEIESISKNATSEQLAAAAQLSDKLSEQEKINASLLQAERDIVDLQNQEGDTAKKLLTDAEKRRDTLQEQLNSIDAIVNGFKSQLALAGITDTALIDQLATLSTLLGVQDDKIGALQEEEKIQAKINERVGVTGAIVEGVGGIMQRLGMRSGIFDDAMKGAKKTMDGMAEASERLDPLTGKPAENFNKTQIAIAGAIKLSEGFRQALFDPLTIALAILDAFLSVDKAAADLQQKIGVNTSEFVAQNDALATSVQQMELMSDLADKTGRNVAAIFTPKQIGEAAELQNLLGLSADQAGELAIIAQEAGRSVGDTADNVFEQVDAFNKVNKTAISGNAVLKDIGDASFDIKASFLAFPDGIAEAATAAKRLGMNLDDVNNIADSLMDFESSIEAELEAQLLTGKQINMAKAREFALSNDLAGLSNEIFKNSVEVAEYGKMNRIQQQALAKSMGVSTEQLAKMAYQRGLDTKMTDEQLKAATGLERSDYERMAAQEQMATALSKLTQAFAPLLDVVASLATAVTPFITAVSSAVGFVMALPLGIGKVTIGLLAAAAAMGKFNMTSLLGGKSMKQLLAIQKAYNAAEKQHGLLLSTKKLDGRLKAARDLKNLTFLQTAALKAHTAAQATLNNVMKLGGNIIKGIMVPVNYALNAAMSAGAVIIRGILIPVNFALNKVRAAGNFVIGASVAAYNALKTSKAAQVAMTMKESAVNIFNNVVTKAGLALTKLQLFLGKSWLGQQAAKLGAWAAQKTAIGADIAAKLTGISVTGLFNTTAAATGPAAASAGGGLATFGAGLGAFGAAAAPAIPIILAIGAGLLLASPAIYAFGLAIKSAFDGIANIVTAVGGAISMMLDKITLEKAVAMGVMGLSFISLAGGLMTLSAAVLFSIPAIGMLGAIALMGPGLLNAGNGMEKMAAGVAKLSEALKTLEVDKLDNLQDFTVKAAVAGVAASGVGAIGEMITSLAGDSGEGENQELLARVDRLISAVEQDRVTKVYMNGNQMSMQMTQENPRQG
jgi:hypothetical protein